MKRLLSVLLAALCALLPITALAQESTTICTSVPSWHTITVVCQEHGAVVVNGLHFSGTFQLTVPRLSVLSLTAAPMDGYALTQVQVATPDGVVISGQQVTLSDIYADNTVSLFFSDQPEAAPPSISDAVTLPEASGNGNRLYDAYLGTGGDMGQLGIVFDDTMQMVDYTLLSVPAEENSSILITASLDEAGQVAPRSLLLTFAQLVKLAQHQQVAQLHFASGDAVVSAPMGDLLSTDMGKLLGLLLHGYETITPDTLLRDWRQVPSVALTAADLHAVQLEIRMLPVIQPDATTRYDTSIWLHWGDEQSLDISPMLPALRIGLKADDLLTTDNRATFAQEYAIAYQAPDASPLLLASQLSLLPDEAPAQYPDIGEAFTVTIPDDGSSPMTTWASEIPIAPCRQFILWTPFAGEGLYWMAEQL